MEKSKLLKVGIIGCGTIGTEIAKACQDRLRNDVTLVGICDIDKKKSLALKEMLKRRVPILELEELIKRIDLIIEAASASALKEVLEKALKYRKDLFAMSVGGLLGKEALLKSTRDRGVKIYLPSGAICGIDGLKSASVGRLDSVALTTRKPPKALEGAPYLKKNRIDLREIKGETILFEGNARDAVKGFPQNVNISAVLSLAGIGARKTRVRIVTSPDYTKNVHEVEMIGSFGRITTRTENVPSKTNPKTSELAILSAIATIEAITNNIRIGT